MTNNFHVVALVGSLRKESLNRQIAEALRDQAPEGITVEIVEGLDQIPFYNENIDGENAPAPARTLRETVAAADGVLVVTPEYNGSMPAVLNNAIDWLSRPYGAGAMTGKPLATIGTALAAWGGKWAHEEAGRSAGIAGAQHLGDLTVSVSSKESDPLSDDVLAKYLAALTGLAAHQSDAA